VNTSERLMMLREELEQEELDAFIVILDEESRLGKYSTTDIDKHRERTPGPDSRKHIPFHWAIHS